MQLMNDKIKLVRRGEGNFIKGLWVPGFVQKIETIYSSVQPISGKELDTFPEGERHLVRFKVYFSSPVNLSLQDTFFYQGIEYKIMADNTWSEAPFLKHTKVFLGSMKNE